MRFVYPSLPCQIRTASPLWAPEYEWNQAPGLAVVSVGLDNERGWLPACAAGLTLVVRRGWILSVGECAVWAHPLLLAVSTSEYLTLYEPSG